MVQVDATDQNGVFKPLSPVAVPENQRVHLNIEPLAATDASLWLERMRKLQTEIAQQRGYFPDSAPDIASDRAR